jgi:hypothetical protein
MKMEKRMEQWCCDTKRGKANDLEEVSLGTHLSTTKSLREKKVLDKIRVYFMQARRSLRLTVF